MRLLLALLLSLTLLTGCTPPPSAPSHPPTPPPVSAPPAPSSSSQPSSIAAAPEPGTIPVEDCALLPLETELIQIDSLVQLALWDEYLFLQYRTGHTFPSGETIGHLDRINITTGKLEKRVETGDLPPFVMEDSGRIRMQFDGVLFYDLHLNAIGSRAEENQGGSAPEPGPPTPVVQDFQVTYNDITYGLTLPDGCSPIRATGYGDTLAVVTMQKGKLCLLTGSKTMPTVQPTTQRPVVGNISLVLTQPVYTPGSQRIRMEFRNDSHQSIQLGRDCLVERLDANNGTIQGSMDNPPVQFPVVAGEHRAVSAYLENLPVGRYRITLPVEKDVTVSGEFAVEGTVSQPPPTGKFTLELEETVIKGTEDWLEFTIHNHSEFDIAFGMGVGLERLLEGQWEGIKTIHPVSVPAIAVGCSAGGSVQDSLDLQDYPQPLPAGKYRVSKQIGQERVYAEFEVKP